MNCTGKGCTGACNQGRDCEGSHKATRRALGIKDEGWPPLDQEDERFVRRVWWGFLLVCGLLMVSSEIWR